MCGKDGRVSLVLTSSLNGDRCLRLVGKPKLFFGQVRERGRGQSEKRREGELCVFRMDGRA